MVPVFVEGGGAEVVAVGVGAWFDDGGAEGARLIRSKKLLLHNHLIIHIDELRNSRRFRSVMGSHSQRIVNRKRIKRLICRLFLIRNTKLTVQNVRLTGNSLFQFNTHCPQMVYLSSHMSLLFSLVSVFCQDPPVLQIELLCHFLRLFSEHCHDSVEDNCLEAFALMQIHCFHRRYFSFHVDFNLMFHLFL